MTPQATIEQALELWERLARPNVMIKVPATEAGIPAIEELTARGVNVNVTLLFSLRALRAGDRRLPRAASSDACAAGEPSTRSPRWPRSSSHASTPRPTRCCPRLGPPRPCGDRQRAARLRAATASASTTSAGSRCASAGARPQRPLWASTGTKDPSYSDVLYVEELIAPGRHQHHAARPPCARSPTTARSARTSSASAGGGRGDPPPRPRKRASISTPSPPSSSAKACSSFCDSYRELLDCIESKAPRT